MRFLDMSAEPQSELASRRRGGCAEATDAVVQHAVRRARDGDRGALQYLYMRYAGDVQRYVRSLVRDPHDAEDITQNVFAKLVEALDRYQDRGVPFSAWLLRVSRNAALDHIRRPRAIPCAEVYPVEPMADGTASESAAALRQALGVLPEDQRLVLLLRHVVGLSPREIAQELGKSEGAVNGLHHRGRRTFKAALTQLDTVPTTAGAGRGR